MQNETMDLFLGMIIFGVVMIVVNLFMPQIEALIKFLDKKGIREDSKQARHRV